MACTWVFFIILATQTISWTNSNLDIEISYPLYVSSPRQELGLGVALGGALGVELGVALALGLALGLALEVGVVLGVALACTFNSYI
jgi:Mg/Co/Ni transporter MgtE